MKLQVSLRTVRLKAVTPAGLVQFIGMYAAPVTGSIMVSWATQPSDTLNSPVVDDCVGSMATIRSRQFITITPATGSNEYVFTNSLAGETYWVVPVCRRNKQYSGRMRHAYSIGHTLAVHTLMSKMTSDCRAQLVR